VQVMQVVYVLKTCKTARPQDCKTIYDYNNLLK